MNNIAYVYTGFMVYKKKFMKGTTLLVILLLLTSCSTMVIDKKIVTGGDRNSPIDIINNNIINADSGDTAVLFLTDEGYRHAATNDVVLYSYRMEKSSSGGIKFSKKPYYHLTIKKAFHPVFGMTIGETTVKGFEHSTTVNNIINGGLTCDITNTGDSTIQELMLVEVPPDGIEISNISFSLGWEKSNTIQEFKNDKGKKAYKITINRRLLPKQSFSIFYACTIDFKKVKVSVAP
jgi:hypothetical protein